MCITACVAVVVFWGPKNGLWLPTLSVDPNKMKLVGNKCQFVRNENTDQMGVSVYIIMPFIVHVCV